MPRDSGRDEAEAGQRHCQRQGGAPRCARTARAASLGIGFRMGDKRDRLAKSHPGAADHQIGGCQIGGSIAPTWLVMR